MLRYVLCAWAARLCYGSQLSGSRQSEHHERIRVHRPAEEQMLGLSADGTVFDASWPQESERPVMRREHREPTHREKQVDAALASLDAKDHSNEDVQDLVEAEKAVRRYQAKKSSVGFADDLLEELLHAINHAPSAKHLAPNIVMNPEFEEGSGWNKDCPSSEYRGHADVSGTSCSTRGFWSGASHRGSNTSGNVWSIKSLTDCFKNTRGAVYQDLNTTEGMSYELQFYAIDAFLDRKASNQSSTLHVEVQSPPGNTLLDEAIVLSGSAYEPVEGSWTLAGPYRFKPQNAGTRLYFYAGGSACPMLDNVGVRAESSASSSTSTTTVVQTTQAAVASTAEPATTEATTETTTVATSTTSSSTTTTKVTTRASTQPSTSTSTTKKPSTTQRSTTTTITTAGTPLQSSSTGQPFAADDDKALAAGASAAASARANGQKPHQQAMEAADAASRAARALGRSSEQVALASAKAAALAVQTAGGTLQQGCVEAGRAASYAVKSEQATQASTATAASNAAFSALTSMGLPADHITECLALAVKTACRASGTQSDALAECAGSTAMAAAQHAGMTEDEQAEVAGKAVEAVIAMSGSSEPGTTEPPQTTTENPELQVLIREVEEAKKAAQDAAIAAGMAHVEAVKAKAAKVSLATTTTTPVPSGATFETEVIVTDAPRNASPTSEPPLTTSTVQTRRACPDSTRAPRGTWVVYNLSATPILHSCLVRSVKDRVPDECCSGSGAENMVGATFEELYYSNDYGTCPTLTFAGPLAGAHVKLQCNFDNTITYGENRCGGDCSCAFQDVYGPGCYRASDALPGTAWFFMTAGCDCTDAKAVQPHQFSLPPLDQNVKAGDILNVGPEEAAKALNRQRQQLRTFYDEMVKDEQVLAGVVGKLSSGKPIADAIFGMDTGELPEQATKRMLDVATQDPGSAKYAINATVSIMGHALSTLKSGKPLADAIFGGDTSHLIQPHLVQRPGARGPGGQDFSLPMSSFGGQFPDFHAQASGQPVLETVRFAGEFKAIIGDNVEQFLQECSAKLKPVACKDAQPGSVIVTLSAASWAELHTANVLIDKGGFELPSFGKFEKEQDTQKGPLSAKQAFNAAAERTPEETKADLLNPDITANDVKVVQSIFDKVHEEEEKEAEDGKPASGSATEASQVPSAEERSASDAIVGIMLLLFGFGCIGFCVFYWAAASKRVKQRLQTAASKRLMKKGKEGDTQLYVTSIEGLEEKEQVFLGKESITIESVGLAITVVDGLADACKSGDAIVKVPPEDADQKGALIKDAAPGDKDIVVTSALVVKKGEKLKIGASEQELTIKSVGKVVMVSPLKTSHAIGSKLRKQGEAEPQADDADKEETAGEETAAEEAAADEAAAEETAEEKPQDPAPAGSQD